MKKDFYSVVTGMRAEAFCLGGDMATEIILEAYPEFTDNKEVISLYLNAYEKLMDESFRMDMEKEDANVKEKLQAGEKNSDSSW